MVNYGRELFKGTATYYARYRPMYPSSLIRFLVYKFSLDGSGRMLDLGCGTGQLTCRFSDWFDEIVGIDMEPEMIEEAKRISTETRVENIDWYIGELDTYTDNFKQTFRLVTIAKAFHWMDREKVLADLYELVDNGGGVAIIDHYNPSQEPLRWQKKVTSLVKQWYGAERRAGKTTYNHPKMTHEEVVSQSNFELEIHKLPAYEQKWTIASILGNLYSTSYGNKRFLGENVKAFEDNLKDELLKINPTGIFKEQIDLSVILALKK
ncbi:methyltransferase [Ornithinibacillus halotolerans]|uniref:Methyltransferase n=1 Tax=Ornithinibacillus halotolerans TaxID=1274357 RepID=A0A916W5K9_9BACI|nr:methyltransferase [Ornithinibacillus halotolerans]